MDLLGEVWSLWVGNGHGWTHKEMVEGHEHEKKDIGNGQDMAHHDTHDQSVWSTRGMAFDWFPPSAGAAILSDSWDR